MNLDYKICKCLRDAGFPLEEIKAGMCVKGESLDIDDVHYYIPNLEELIEECGDGFNSLRKIFLQEDLDGLIGDAWMSETGETNHERFYYGKTPLIAVANLYLKLHAKV